MNLLNKKTLCIVGALVLLAVLMLCLLPLLTRPDSGEPQDQQTTNPSEEETMQPDSPVTTTPEVPDLPAPPSEGSTEISAYKGKTISILGDSISAFRGFIPTADGVNLAHQSRYPEGFIDGVEDMWWMQVIDALDAKLGINDSWRGTEVYNNSTGNNGIVGVKTSMSSLTRITNLCGKGTPDIILFYGGTNDIIMNEMLGMFNPNYASKTPDLTATRWSTVAEAYAETVLRLRYLYPTSHVVAILPAESSAYTDEALELYNNTFINICKRYSVPYVDLRETVFSHQKDTSDGIHPNLSGMKIIADAVLETILASCPVVPGESETHTVSHRLTHVTSSMSICPRIRDGAPFYAVLDGSDFSVTVSMDGKDITADCYKDGIISIPAATGDITVTAKGKAVSPYAEHLQQPGAVCPGTNLWALLPHSTKYYSGSEWTTYGANLRSITFPVNEGDHIWATSFGPASTNGSGGASTSGVRVTFFSEHGVISSNSAAAVYNECKAKGFIVAPKGAVAINVPMWTDSPAFEVYILNREHNYVNGVCSICDAAQ